MVLTVYLYIFVFFLKKMLYSTLGEAILKCHSQSERKLLPETFM